MSLFILIYEYSLKYNATSYIKVTFITQQGSLFNDFVFAATVPQQTWRRLDQQLDEQLITQSNFAYQFLTQQKGRVTSGGREGLSDLIKIAWRPHFSNIIFMQKMGNSQLWN